MKFRLDFFSKELVLFGLTLTVGIATASWYTRSIPLTPVEPLQFTWQTTVIALVFFLAFSFVLSRFSIVARWTLTFFFYVVIFSGSQAVLGIAMRYWQSVAVALALTVGAVLIRRIVMHDVAVMMGIAGISALVGTSITPSVGIVVLVLLALYDIIAVYRTKHMVALADAMIRNKTVFGFFIPVRWSGFFLSKDVVRLGEDSMVLGSGDIGLPLLFASSLVSTSVSSAVLVALFSLGGLFITHLLFMNQDRRQPMAALPPIATMAILGYLAAVLLNV